MNLLITLLLLARSLFMIVGGAVVGLAVALLVLLVLELVAKGMK